MPAISEDIEFKDGYYVDEPCKTKWKSEPPAYGIGFHILKERQEGDYRIIEEIEIVEFSVCKSQVDGAIINAVADQNREAAKSPVLPEIRKGQMPTAKNPETGKGKKKTPAGKKKSTDKPKTGKPDPGKSKTDGQQKFPEAEKTEKVSAAKSWKQGIESKATQTDKLNALINRTKKASIQIVGIGRELNGFGNPANDAIDDLHVDKETEKAIKGLGQMVGAMTLSLGIVEERIARDLDNPPDIVAPAELKKLRNKYYPESVTSNSYARLDASKPTLDKAKADKPDKKKEGETKKKK